MVTGNVINANSSGIAVYDAAGTWAGRTITAGTGISVSNGSGVAGNPTINAISGGFAPIDATNATYALVANTRYIVDRGGGVAFTLPASGVLGDAIKITGKLGAWTVAQNANQQIVFGSVSTTLTTGGLASTNVGDSVTLVCTTAGASTIWTIDSAVGNITIT